MCCNVLGELPELQKKTATSRERGNYVAAPSHAVSHLRFQSSPAKLHLLSESCVKCVAMCWVSCLSYKKNCAKPREGKLCGCAFPCSLTFKVFIKNNAVLDGYGTVSYLWVGGWDWIGSPGGVRYKLI